MMENQTCSNCRFARTVNRVRECHKRPPSVGEYLDDFARFPRVLPAHWCSEWRKNDRETQGVTALQEGQKAFTPEHATTCETPA